MNWTAPQGTRADAPPVGDERTLLEAWLESHHRQTLAVEMRRADSRTAHTAAVSNRRA